MKTNEIDLFTGTLWILISIGQTILFILFSQSFLFSDASLVFSYASLVIIWVATIIIWLFILRIRNLTK